MVVENIYVFNWIILLNTYIFVCITQSTPLTLLLNKKKGIATTNMNNNDKIY